MIIKFSRPKPFFIIPILLLVNHLNVYSAEQSKKEIKINFINFSEQNYIDYFLPILPSEGYTFSRDYSYSDDISKPAKDTIGFYTGKIVLEGEKFHRISSNAVDKNGTAFQFEWDISDGFFLKNRKEEALKFSAETIFESEQNDVNTVFAGKLLETKAITDLNPLYSDGEEVKEIKGYEFKYNLQRSSTYRAVRTSSEILFFCAIGVGNYYMTKAENEVDWQYKYTWHDAKRKVEDGWYWDPNNFNTNTVYHLYAGMTYYQIARSNYYTIPESLAWTFAGSFFWEFVGEWREQVSLNDMIFTPMLGSITGEALIQTTKYIEKKMDPGILREIITLAIDPLGWFNRKLDSSNSGDIRVRLVFVNPIQTAVENKVQRDVLNR